MEIDLLIRRYRRIEEREDRRAALAAWVQVEINRDTQKRPQPFDLEEIVSWLGHGFQDSKERAPEPDRPSTETLMERAHQFMLLYGASKQNGQRAEGGHDG